MLFILNNGGEIYLRIICSHTAKRYLFLYNHCFVIWIATHGHGFIYSYYNIAITIL